MYLVKSRYHVIRSELDVEGMSSISGIVQWWKFLWHLKIPNKVKILLWRSFHNIIPYLKDLESKEIACSLICGRCGVLNNLPVMHWCCAIFPSQFGPYVEHTRFGKTHERSGNRF